MSYIQTIYNLLRKLGFSEIGAVAMLGNWNAESGCEPNRLENDFDSYRRVSRSYTQDVTTGKIGRQQFGTDRKGYGLAQWTFCNQANTEGRKFNLYDFWKKSGKALDDAEMQCDFCWWEMTVGGYSHVRSVVTDETDLYTAVSKLCTQYEQPSRNNIDARFQAAKDIRSQLDLTGWESGSSGAETEEKGKTMTKDEAVKKVLDIARGEIGYHEQGDNWTKYAQDLDRTNWYNGPKNGFAWCDVFVDWLFWKSFGDPLGREMICQPTGSAGAGCLYSVQYYQSAGRWFQIPDVGDQIFFSYSPGEYSHTGIVESVQNGIVTTIEGNTSDQVARRQYTNGASQIAGYGRPRWELASGASGSGTSSGSSGSTPSGGTGRILKKGCKGEDVRALQENLQKLGYGRLLEPDGADGDFGKNTYNAVIQFQMEHGLYVDGEAGPDTLGAIQEALKGAEEPVTEPDEPSVPDEPDEPDEPRPDIPATEFWPPRQLREGMKGKDVEVLCAILKARGWDVNYVDDAFGSFLDEKVRAFQTAYGLEADGIVGPKTWEKLFERT